MKHSTSQAQSSALLSLGSYKASGEGPPDTLSTNLTHWLRGASVIQSAQSQMVRPPERSVLYVLKRKEGGLVVKPVVARPLQYGGYGISQPWTFGRLAASTAVHVTREDRCIAQLGTTGRLEDESAQDDPEIFELLLTKIIATGRAHFQSIDSPPLRLAPSRIVELAWRLQSDGSQVVQLFTPDHVEAFDSARRWFVDTSSWESGPLNSTLPDHLMNYLLQAPRVAPSDAAAVAAHLKQIADGIDMPLPFTDFKRERIEVKPKVVMRLIGSQARLSDCSSLSFPLIDPSKVFSMVKVPHASLSFDYNGMNFDSSRNEYSTVRGERVLSCTPDTHAEAIALQSLTQFGLIKLLDYDNRFEHLFSFPRHEASIWLRFMDNHLEELRHSGWRIEIDESFPFRTVTPDEGDYWTIEASQGSGFWLSVDLGIKVNGKRMPLLPVLVSALKALDERPTAATVERLNFDGKFLAPMPDGQLLALPFDRVRSILLSFLDLFNEKSRRQDTKISLSLIQAAQLADLARKDGWSWNCPDRLNELIEALRDCQTKAQNPPAQFKATLRDYQKEGLGWLQFLKRFALGGILADDMGLGKTVQTIAHLCVEKANGDLKKPALIVCPTSVLPNWIKETERFAPHLRVASLYGSERQLSNAKSADIAITTYALLRHDLNWFAKQEWSTVVLDEAQAIKNAKTTTALAAKSLKAKQRICLTGTPVENHLGELWSQFDFLMPGILGTSDQFRRSYRRPIEEFNDQQAKQRLATQVRPFILRRTKERVTAELPPKSEILQRFELEGEQRDLYETVRLAMHERVQQAIATKGFERSQIVILEALLRLRQVCCDPRLISLPFAQGIKESAKLKILLEMLPELLDQDRKVLLFSQFTSMLDLIIPELKALGCPFVEIRGDTKDRLTPVEQFQMGKVPLLLLSLKAGGTGLNLTAADTVIHYDPWWNPAVENQATDRAHRIGQTKPVFVYKLITLGTVEDRMLLLQERKKRIADSVYEHEKEGNLIFDESDLELLFKPISKGAV